MKRRMKKRQATDLTIDSGSMNIAAALIVTKFIAVSIAAAISVILK